MSETTRKILDEVLRLPVAERAVLAAEIVASLDAEDDEAVQAAWLEEIERRVRRSMAGETKASDWETVRARIEQRVKQARRA